MAGPNKERCADCIKWEPRTGNFGLCRAHAPQPTVLKAQETDNFILAWPSTGINDWCANDFEKASIENLQSLGVA